jgi:cytochrome b involved in lipid metabolism
MDAFSHYEAIEIDEDALPEVDMDQVALHDKPEDLWIVVFGKVYDVTE